jgi:hypothetical protein
MTSNIFDDLQIPIESYDEDVAKEVLASLLHVGCLSLVIGAGSSKGLGLPVWWELVNRCLKKAKIKTKVNSKTSSQALMTKMDLVERKIKNGNKYRELVRECIYQGISYDKSIIKQDLLIAFGAMLMGSNRGSVGEVVNFNFDDVLEWYLGLHGFKTQVVKTIPSLHQRADVTIYHPHGYLPKSDEKKMSDFLIFSKSSSEKRQGKPHNLWMEMLRGLFQNKVVLFVGLSGEDPIFGPILSIINELIKGERPTGFWIFGKKKKKESLDYLKNRNVVPIVLKSNNKIPEFLLSICQEAAKI